MDELESLIAAVGESGNGPPATLEMYREAVAALQDGIRRLVYTRTQPWKKMARSIAKLVPIPDPSNFVRCSGLVECPVCGLALHDHPHLSQLALTIACDGTLMHL